MGYAVILSGQGSEKQGMLKDVITKSEIARDIVAQGEKICQVNLFDIINSGDLKRIRDPKVNQFMLFLYHIIYSKLIMEHLEIEPEFVAGHSIGQLCSYAVAEVLSLEEMLEFLTKRTAIVNDESICNKAQFVNCFWNYL